MANNLVFIVMDSCRYDSFAAADHPNLDRLGPAERRYSYASWTSPSHQTFLMGQVPHTSPKGVFASEVFGGLKGDLAIGSQLGIQLLAATIAAVYAGLATWAIAKVVDALVGLRIAEHGEEEGLDLHQHGESGYNL